MAAKRADIERADELLARIETDLTRNAIRLMKIRRHIHRNPELSGEEYLTTAYISKELKAAGVPHRAGQKERGVITEIVRGSRPSAPVVAMRADIDALPIQEENEVPYRSRKPGVMHACGHDAHTAILLATTVALYRVGKLPTGWRAIFQPSEEAGTGAREMLRRGALKGVDAIVALHVDPNQTTGLAGITPGPRTAFCQDFEIIIHGRGGHAARPHSTVDPIAVAAQLVTLIYQAIPRGTDARDPVVVSIGMLNGGHAANVIPDKVSMKGTIRSLNATVSKGARELLQRLCAGTARSFDAEISPTFEELLPGLVNDLQIASHAADCARRLLGSDQVTTRDRPSLGAEDFADYLPFTPGCMITLGARIGDSPVRPLHTSTFDIDERALLVGAKLLARILLDWPEGGIHRTEELRTC